MQTNSVTIAGFVGFSGGGRRDEAVGLQHQAATEAFKHLGFR